MPQGVTAKHEGTRPYRRVGRISRVACWHARCAFLSGRFSIPRGSDQSPWLQFAEVKRVLHRWPFDAFPGRGPVIRLQREIAPSVTTVVAWSRGRALTTEQFRKLN